MGKGKGKENGTAEDEMREEKEGFTEMLARLKENGSFSTLFSLHLLS